MAKKVAKKAAPLNTAALTGDPANPREISESAAAGLGYSMAEFGDLSGITYNLRTGELVAGHQRMGQIRQRWGDLAIEPLADEDLSCRVQQHDADGGAIGTILHSAAARAAP